MKITLSKWLAEPPLAQRLLWRDPIRSETLISEDRGLLARAFGTLFGFGGLVGFVMLPIGEHTDRLEWAFAVLAVASIALSAVCLVGYRRLPIRFFQAITVVGTAMLTLAGAASSHGAEGVFAIFYVWIAILSSLFFSLRMAAIQIAVAVVAFSSILFARETPFALNYVISMVVVLFTSGVIIALLRARVEALAAGLASEAQTDSLTALANRRGFDDRFELEAGRSERSGGSLSLIICDLDRFKAVNDELGHGEGDLALQRAASVVAASVRLIDAVSRLGGEEFAVLLPEADADEAFVVAERVRCGILEEFADHPVKLTASCGVSTVNGGGEDAQRLFQEADSALYRAKRAGRNCSITYEAALDPLAASSTK
ncbi:MAG: GGDEF domain-containing protein [Actinomycetota bacterium]|nr:GGDEF domain-containing protein [Actinomycetota bacterium]